MGLHCGFIWSHNLTLVGFFSWFLWLSLSSVSWIYKLFSRGSFMQLGFLKLSCSTLVCTPLFNFICVWYPSNLIWSCIFFHSLARIICYSSGEIISESELEYSASYGLYSKIHFSWSKCRKREVLFYFVGFLFCFYFQMEYAIQCCEVVSSTKGSKWFIVCFCKSTGNYFYTNLVLRVLRGNHKS